MSDWKFGDVIQRDMGKLIVMVCGEKSGFEWKFEDGYVICLNDPGWGIVLKNANHHHNYPVHKTCVIATEESWEKVE